MIDNSIFLIGLSLILIHEMDAIRCKEWRIFPGLSLLKDKTGYIIFLFAHIPIFYFLVWQLTSSSDIETFRMGFDIFLILHLGLHVLYLKHKNNEFKDWISWTIILGSAMCGFFDLIILCW
ncbi:MAG: hypothetical protein L3J41_02860 [Melioribacteraceae bacterium]|nr:hypothetical protein [Melioribacteraceae bacterium]